MAKIIVLLGLCFALASPSAAESLRSLKTHADEARSVLSTLSEECTRDKHLIAVEHTKALHSIFNCSYSAVIDGLANVALETGTMAVLDYSVISKLVRQITKCASELINPFKVIECDYEGIISAYSEIQSMITSTENFITDMKSMIPPLKEEIENCLQSSSSEYKLFLNELVHKAKVCEAAL